MEYQLVQKVNSKILVLMTPGGIQIWMKGKVIERASETCLICGKKIGIRSFFSPMAGVTLDNPTERFHASCAKTLALLPMTTNTFALGETNENGKLNELAELVAQRRQQQRRRRPPGL